MKKSQACFLVSGIIASLALSAVAVISQNDGELLGADSFSGCTTITFDASAINEGTTIESSTSTYTSSDLGVSSVAYVKGLGVGSGNSAVRLGSSSTAGSVTVSFASSCRLGQVSAYAAQYSSSDTTTISLSSTLNGSSTALAKDSAALRGTTESAVDLYYLPTSPIEVDSLTLTIANRCYLYSLHLYVLGGSSSSSSSSEETSSSSSSLSSSSSSSSSSTSDPYEGVDQQAFETSASYSVASSYEDAQLRTAHYLSSGTNQSSNYLPSSTGASYAVGTKYKRATNATYTYRSDGSYESYALYNADGSLNETIYYGGAYTGLNEVAAYCLAFGEVPPNMGYNTSSAGKSAAVSSWWRMGRANYASFSGPSASKYTYEPAVPGMAYYSDTSIYTGANTYSYYETDFGDWSSYNSASYVDSPSVYNNGSSIVSRGVLRFIFIAKYATTGSGNRLVSSNEISANSALMGESKINERYVFYTYNHYSDFQEYLNYYDGWGYRFGSMTNGATSTGTGTPTAYPGRTLAALPFAS